MARGPERAVPDRPVSARMVLWQHFCAVAPDGVMVLLKKGKKKRMVSKYGGVDGCLAKRRNGANRWLHGWRADNAGRPWSGKVPADVFLGVNGFVGSGRSGGRGNTHFDVCAGLCHGGSEAKMRIKARVLGGRTPCRKNGCVMPRPREKGVT